VILTLSSFRPSFSSGVRSLDVRHDIRARGARADLASAHDEINPRLAGDATCDRAFDGGEDDDDLGAAVSQTLGLATRRCDRILDAASKSRRCHRGIDDAQDTDLDASDGAQDRRSCFDPRGELQVHRHARRRDDMQWTRRNISVG